ncbi:hypothetical protein IQ07DRAFT_43687 [Pyrenochaeta sp. DS3sAY3a]|nr:hypothetical protein IQ07DRAFT_43687 [Pyrenochaeta sp. DS3sAY3a]
MMSMLGRRVLCTCRMGHPTSAEPTCNASRCEARELAAASCGRCGGNAWLLAGANWTGLCLSGCSAVPGVRPAFGVASALLHGEGFKPSRSRATSERRNNSTARPWLQHATAAGGTVWVVSRDAGPCQTARCKPRSAPTQTPTTGRGCANHTAGLYGRPGRRLDVQPSSLLAALSAALAARPRCSPQHPRCAPSAHRPVKRAIRKSNAAEHTTLPLDGPRRPWLPRSPPPRPAVRPSQTVGWAERENACPAA